MSVALTGQILLTTGAAIVMLVGPFTLISMVLLVTERNITRIIRQRFGDRGMLLTAWIGVPIHELSHVCACWLFRHRVKKITWLRYDRKSGTLGEVVHAYDRDSVYQLVGNFFVGVAPLFGAALVIRLAYHWLVGASVPAVAGVLHGLPDVVTLARSLLHHIATILGSLLTPETLTRPGPLGFLYLALAVGSHAAPSRRDLEGTLPGFGVLVLLFLTSSLIMVMLRQPPDAWVGPVAVVLLPVATMLLFAAACNVLLTVALMLLLDRG